VLVPRRELQGPLRAVNGRASVDLPRGTRASRQPLWRTDRDRLHSMFDALLTLFAVLVLPSILIEAVASERDPVWAIIGEGLDWFIWVGFALSVAGALVVARDKRSALRSHAIDVVLVVLTPPIVPEAWQALRALRTLRILRLLLAGFRLHRHMRRLSRKNVVGPAAVVLLVAMLCAATAVSVLEPEHVPSVGQGMWWALSRATALGDGGVSVTTLPGRLVEILVVVSGLAFLSLITAAIATVFVQSEEAVDPELSKLDEIIQRLDRLEARLDGDTGRG
jgi:voltage-gated potassium channel